MTLPDERYRSLRMTRSFLYDLLDPKKTPNVPSIVRSQARGCLRHWPSEWDLEQITEALPDLYARQMEPVSRLFRQYEENKKNNEST
jgi:hypothetical protein